MGNFIFILARRNPQAITREIYSSHVEYLRKQTIEKRLLLAGPIKNRGIILQLYCAETLDEAETLVNNDPYVSHGYYQSYRGYEWVMANEENNWLMDTPRVQEMLRNLP